MTELLIKAIDATHPDPEKDRRGCYKRGDIVQVYEDGRCTEPPSPDSKMVIVKVPGLSVELARKYADSHNEPQQQTRTWNKPDYDKAVASSVYDEFISAPTVLAQREEQATIKVSAEQWLGMKTSGDYAPFNSKPAVTKILIGGYDLTGTVTLVDLQGDVITTITRRKFRIRVDDIPLVIRQKLKDDREVTVTFDQVKSFLRNKVTNRDEG